MTMISGALNDALSNQEKWSSPISDLHGLFISIKWFFQFRLALLKVKTLVTSTGIKIVSFSSLKHSLPWPVSILCVIDFATKTSCHFYLLALKKTFQKMKKNLVRKPCTKWSTFISEIGLSSLKKKKGVSIWALQTSSTTFDPRYYLGLSWIGKCQRLKCYKIQKAFSLIRWLIKLIICCPKASGAYWPGLKLKTVKGEKKCASNWKPQGNWVNKGGMDTS